MASRKQEVLPVNELESNRAILDNREAAHHLNLSPKTLNNSRTTGLLCGVKAPPFKKLGKAVRYDRAALDEWLAQFKEQTSTSENAA